MPDRDTPPDLVLQGIDKRFGGTHALRDVSLRARSGRVHALLGGNGSGKSTLVKVLAGIHRADAGRITLGDTSCPADQVTPPRARALGLRFVHQNAAVFPEMSVAENLVLGATYPVMKGVIDWRALRRTTHGILDRYGIAARPGDLMSDLRPATQMMIAIARALQPDEHGNISVLVLDEPTAALPSREVELVLGAVRRCTQERQAVVFVTHRIDEVLSVADDVTVLRDGSLAMTGPMNDLTEDQLIEAIVGRRVRRLEQRIAQKRDARRAEEPILQCERLSGGPLNEVDLTVRQGEVVGVAGLLGSGRTKLLQLLFGCQPVTGGRMLFRGRVVTIRDPATAMRLGIAYIPEDRELDATYQTLSVRENLTIGQLRRYWAGIGFRHRQERRDAASAIAEFGIRASGPQAEMASLSGGNQQKVVLARWLRRRPTLLLLDEPTQGVDVGARADIHRFIRGAVDDGAAALIVTSDFAELATVCDRVVVLRDGRLVDETAPPELTAGNLTELVYASKESAL